MGVRLRLGLSLGLPLRPGLELWLGLMGPILMGSSSGLGLYWGLGLWACGFSLRLGVQAQGIDLGLGL